MVRLNLIKTYLFSTENAQLSFCCFVNFSAKNFDFEPGGLSKFLDYF